MVVLDTVSVCSTGVAGWLAESRCVKREVSRPQAADGYGHGSCDSCEGQLLDAEMGPQLVVYGQPAAYGFTIAPRDHHVARVLRGRDAEAVVQL